MGTGASLLAATTLANLANFVFHAVAGRFMGPADYGALGSLLAVLLTLSVPVGAVQVAISREISVRRELGEATSLRRLLVSAVCAGGAIATATAFAAPVVARFLHLGDVTPVLWLAAFTFPAIVAVVPRAYLVGQLRFRAVALAVVAGAACRLILGWALLTGGAGVAGAMAASVAGELATVAVLLLAVRASLGGTGTPLGLSGRELTPTVAAFAGLWALAGSDAVLARHHLTPAASGAYAAAIALARAALFLPQTIATVAFPRFTADDPVQARRALRGALVGTVGIGLGAVVGLVAAADLVVPVVFGAGFAPPRIVLAVLALAAVGLGAANVLVHYQLARRRPAALASWLGVAAVCAGTTLWHRDAVAVATVTGLVVAGVVFALGRGVARQGCSTHGGQADLAPAGRLWEQPGPALDVTVVVPFYNPGPEVRDHLVRLAAVLGDAGVSYEVVAVADGCTDGSPDAVDGLEHLGVRCVRLPANRGKGEALRIGLSEGRGRYLGFIDADGDLDPELWRPFLELMRLYEPDVVLGSKRHPLSQVQYPFTRRVISWGYQQLVRTLFRLPVRDTQTGIKLVRRDVLAAVLPRTVEQRFAFDLELFVVARRLGFRRFFEAPITLDFQFRSTVSSRAVVRTLCDTLTIAARAHILRTYDRTPLTSRGRTVAPLADQEGRLRILVCNWRDLAHPRAGGAEVYTHEVLRRWVADGHDVTLFTAAVAGRPTTELLDGVRVVRRGGRFTVYRKARRFYRTEGRGRFDLVVDEVNTRPFGCADWVKDARVVALIHQVAREVWFSEMALPLALLGRYVLEPRWLRRYADVPTLTISSSSRASLAEYGLRNVTVVPVGITRPDVLPPLKKEARPTVVFVGRLSANKRPDHAIEAFALAQRQVPDAQLWVIGAGPIEDELKRLAPEGVRFFGRVSQEEKFAIVARAHVLVATSTREGWAMVVDEAAAVGTLTIAYAVPGLQDSVPRARGVLVPPSPPALADELAKWLPIMAASPALPGWAGGAVSWDEVAHAILHAAVPTQPLTPTTAPEEPSTNAAPADVAA